MFTKLGTSLGGRQLKVRWEGIHQRNRLSYFKGGATADAGNSGSSTRHLKLIWH